MTQDEAFLQSILEAPEDDTPRLIYADWLDEHGDPERAEFIRVQCELARLPEGDARRARLKLRERALLAQHEATWAAPLRGRVSSWKFRRGFVEQITTGARALAASPHLNRLRRLTVSWQELADEARRVLQRRFGKVLHLN
jgi:uncharacterized protein (TIGR02996 family)